MDFNGLEFFVDFLEVFSSFIFEMIKSIIIVIFFLWFLMGCVVYRLNDCKGSLVLYMLCLVILFYLWVFGMVFELVVEGISYFVWVVLFVFFVYGFGICLGI